MRSGACWQFGLETLNSPVARRLCIAVVLAATVCCINIARAATAAEPRTWAVLVACENYQKAAKLQFTNNDVARLADTLISHGGLDYFNITRFTEPGYSLTKKNLMEQIPNRLKQAKPGDTMIVYFSGHGFRDSDGKLYLAPVDIDPENPTATGIPVEWLRDQLDACQAEFKLLVLDACHAGSEKGDGREGDVSAKDLSETFGRSAGVVTLASSTGDEKSLIWHFKQQSLFSYWLTQGLKGHADTNGDGAVNIDELYEYIHGHVTQTAEVRFSRPQTPVRIVGPRIKGVPTIVKLVPQPLKQVVADMSEQLAGAMEERSLARVGVLEFTTDTKFGEMLGGNFGLLGRYCAEELERRLTDRSAGKYTVVERGRLQAALREQQFQVDDLFKTVSLKRLSESTGGMPVVARGTLIDRSGRLVNLRCKLVQTEGDATFVSVGGVAQLNENEWAMLGRSVVIPPADRRPPPPSVEPKPDNGEKPNTEEDRVVDRADERSKGPHPLQDPNFPYRVKFIVNGKERPFKFKKVDEYTECFVGVKAGDTYHLWIENRSGEKRLMRLLVDGLNTLPEKEFTKGIDMEVWGKRVNLDEARAWVLDPNARGVARIRNIPTWGIEGFVTETGKYGKLKEFTVVEAEKSLAARQQFTDQLGMITAAFYAPAPAFTRSGPTLGASGLGTTGGREVGRDLAEIEAIPGKLLAVVHIKYVDADTLND